MSISTKEVYERALVQPWHRSRIQRGSVGMTAGRAHSQWTSGGETGTGTAPGAAAAPTSATTGALGLKSTSGIQRILRFLWRSGMGGMVTIADRLSHQSGLSGTATGAQTTNLPTAALTRKTNGVGVMAALEIYSTIGATGTTVTAGYVDTADASHTTEATTWGGTGFNTARRFLLLALAAGDIGFKSVASVNAVASTTGVGDFGVTLFYPLTSFALGNEWNFDGEALLQGGGWFPQVGNNDCLFFILTPTTSSSGVIVGEVDFGEDA